MEKKTKIKKPKWTFYSWSNHYIQWIPRFNKHPLMWKDKYETPRCELSPTVEVNWLWFTLRWVQGNDEFWEQWLWVTEYCENDIVEAQETWPWVDMKNSQSTWRNFDELKLK